MRKQFRIIRRRPPRLHLIKRFDREVGELLELLKKSGRLNNTIIVVSSDNGMPFPHAKANLYDHGTRVPLIIGQFNNQLKQHAVNASFVNLIDLMPSFLDMAGIKNIPEVDGKSLLPILKGEKKSHREEVFLERERHCLCRLDAGMLAGKAHLSLPLRFVACRNSYVLQPIVISKTVFGVAFRLFYLDAK